MLSGSIICQFSAALTGLSGVVQVPSLVTTYSSWGSGDQRIRGGTFVVTAYPDGRIKHYEVSYLPFLCFYLSSVVWFAQYKFTPVVTLALLILFPAHV